MSLVTLSYELINFTISVTIPSFGILPGKVEIQPFLNSGVQLTSKYAACNCMHT